MIRILRCALGWVGVRCSLSERSRTDSEVETGTDATELVDVTLG